MKFNIHGKKLDVTDSIKNYIEEKIGRLDKYFENPDDITATVLIKLRGNDQVVEATINANSFVLRGEEEHKDLYASIDKVSDKIERQIRKNKTRMKKKVNKDLSAPLFVLDFEEPDENNNVIVKTAKDCIAIKVLQFGSYFAGDSADFIKHINPKEGERFY